MTHQERLDRHERVLRRMIQMEGWARDQQQELRVLLDGGEPDPNAWVAGRPVELAEGVAAAAEAHAVNDRDIRPPENEGASYLHGPHGPYAANQRLLDEAKALRSALRECERERNLARQRVLAQADAIKTLEGTLDRTLKSNAVLVDQRDRASGEGARQYSEAERLREVVKSVMAERDGVQATRKADLQRWAEEHMDLVDRANDLRNVLSMLWDRADITDVGGPLRDRVKKALGRAS